MTEDRRIIGQEDATWQNETALVQAAQRDIAAFSPLYAHYVDGIYSYLLTRTGQGHADDAADLTQQVFLRALDALPRYQSRESISIAAWLFRIASNAATDWQRRQHPTLPLESVPDELHPEAPETADGPVLRRADIAEARRLLAMLDEGTREAIILRFTAQLTLREIGAVLGISEDAARKRISRALHTLKERHHDAIP